MHWLRGNQSLSKIHEACIANCFYDDLNVEPHREQHEDTDGTARLKPFHHMVLKRPQKWLKIRPSKKKSTLAFS